MKTKLFFCLLTFISINAHANLTNGPIISPTFPDRTPDYAQRNYSPELKKIRKITNQDLITSHATQVVINGKGDDKSYFIQKKKIDGSHQFIIAEKNYQEMIALGEDLTKQEILVVSDDEYENEMKNVDLVVMIDTNDAISASCANGIAAGAISGAISGTPGGAIVGGFLGGLAGGCFNR